MIEYYSAGKSTGMRARLVGEGVNFGGLPVWLLLRGTILVRALFIGKKIDWNEKTGKIIDLAPIRSVIRGCLQAYPQERTWQKTQEHRRHTAAGRQTPGDAAPLAPAVSIVSQSKFSIRVPPRRMSRARTKRSNGSAST